MPDTKSNLLGMDEITAMTTTAAAAALGCCPSTVRNLIRAGKLEAHRLGHAYRVTREAVTRFRAGGVR